MCSPPTNPAEPTKTVQVNLTAELRTAVKLHVPLTDDWRRQAYNSAIEAVERLLQTSLAGQVVSWSWDVQHDEVSEQD